MMRKIAFFCILHLFLVSHLSVAISLPNWEIQKGNRCSNGYQLVSDHEVVPYKKQFCTQRLSTWSLVRLTNNKVLTGWGYGCGLAEYNPQYVGETLCKPNPRVYSDRDPQTQELLESYAQEAAKYQKESESGISPRNVFLVDYNSQEKTYLYRGSNPVEGGIFQFNNLKKAIYDAAVTAGVSPPTEFFLVDITLLNPFFSPSEKVEEKFFVANPDLGRVIRHPVYGALSNPNNFPESIRRALVDKVSVDDVPSLIEQINELMLQKQTKSVVLYVHCEAGKDRTGEVVGGYRMHYNNYTFRQALMEANTVAGRQISVYNKYGMMWVGYWLRYKRGIDVGPIE